MPGKTTRRVRLRRVGILLLILASSTIVYREAYFRTTSLIVGKPSLDWYAYRKFASRAHFNFFIPAFLVERHFDRDNPGYALDYTIGDRYMTGLHDQPAEENGGTATPISEP